jgi:hypothetical protein
MQTAKAFDALMHRAEQGATVIFLNSEFFLASDAGGWLSVGELATIAALRLPGESIDAWGVEHPIFAGVSGPGLLADAMFAQLLPDHAFVDLDAGGQILAAAHRSRMHPDEYRSGVLLSVHEHGAGRIILNTFQILENLGSDTAADRLLLNLVRYAAIAADVPEVSPSAP